MNYSQNMRAFFDMIAVSEIGAALLAKSDDGYDVMVGSTAALPLLFHDYTVHPGDWKPNGPGLSRNHAMDSDAAGRYQFMGMYWPTYRAQLKLPDFGPASQDAWCYQLIRECHATDDVERGSIHDAIVKCKSRWASFPSAGYGQHENSMNAMVTAYKAAGGVLLAGTDI